MDIGEDAGNNPTSNEISVPLKFPVVYLFGAGVVLAALDLFKHAGIVIVLVDGA